VRGAAVTDPLGPWPDQITSAAECSGQHLET